jgi:hypothetical protein
MRTMIKASLVALSVAALVSETKAQTVSTKTSDLNPGGIYIKGGLNLSNISTKSDGSIDDANTLASFNAGVIADLPLASVLSLQTGLQLSGKGAKANYYFDDNNRNDNYVKSKFNPLYLELPVNLVFKFPVADNARFFVGAGPYVAMGLGGKTKTESKLLGVTSTSERDIAFNDDDPTTSGQEDAGVNKLRRFDYGLNGVAGVEVNRFTIGVGYGWGLAKISSIDDDDNDKNKYRVFSVSLGVRL